jgi:hypothetical protein
VESQIIAELEVREGKNEAESALKRLIDAWEETSSEESELPGRNPCDNAQSRNTDQDRHSDIWSSCSRDYSKDSGWKFLHSNLYARDLKIGLISLLQEVLQWPNTLTKMLKRTADRMWSVITCRAWKALFQEKENKNKEEELAKLEWEKKRERKKNLKITAGKSSIEKTNDKRWMC